MSFILILLTKNLWIVIQNRAFFTRTLNATTRNKIIYH